MEAHLLDKVFQKYLSNLTRVYKGLRKGCAWKNVEGIIGGEFQEARSLWEQWRIEENRKEDGNQWNPSGSLSVVGILAYFFFVLSSPMVFVCLIVLFFFFFFVVDFVIHWNETAMGLHVFPSRSPLPPPSPPAPSRFSQCTRSEYLSHASNLDWWSVSP